MLQRCSDEGLLELAEVLLKDGEADPNGTTDTAAITPALMAANRGHGAVLELLFESGADFTLCTGDSREGIFLLWAIGQLLAAFLGEHFWLFFCLCNPFGAKVWEIFKVY